MNHIVSVLKIVLAMLDKDDKDDLFDLVEKRLAERQLAQPTRARALALGGLQGVRLALGVPDDDVDQIHPR